MTRRHLDARDVPAVLLRAFPGYRGRSFVVVVGEAVTLTGAYWDGGSRSVYRALDLATGRTEPAAATLANPPQFGGPARSPKVTIPAGWAIVEHSTFRGRDDGLVFYIRPDNAAALLPAPAKVELSRAALVVLEVSNSTVSTFRRQTARRDFGLQAAAYDSGLAECKRLGLLNAAGAVTVAGRNLRESLGGLALKDKLRLPRAWERAAADSEGAQP